MLFWDFSFSSCLIYYIQNLDLQVKTYNPISLQYSVNLAEFHTFLFLDYLKVKKLGLSLQ